MTDRPPIDSLLPDIPVKCLIVDDLEENRLALSALLKDSGVELLVAASGVAALELLLAHDVALALLDVQMPEMDGFELAELIRGSARTRSIPIIFVTAGAHDQRRLFKGYDAGAVDFIFKPIEPHILKSKADVFFQLYRNRQQIAHDLKQRTETLRLNEMFVAVLGHDLRTPLNAIVTAGHLLQHTTEAEIVSQVAEQLLRSGKRMSRMIADMLDLARARLAGGIVLQRRPANLSAITQTVLDECRAAYPDCRMELACHGDLQGEWDEDRMHQMLSNLVGNALRHGDGTAQIDIDGDSPTTLRICISNPGHIPETALHTIFDPFRGNFDRSARSEGLGLGLYIVQQIVHAHHGHISATSAEAEPVRFVVRIPRRLVERVEL